MRREFGSSYPLVKIGGVGMAVEDNKALVSRIADDIWNRGNLAAVAEVMAPSAAYHGPHMPNGTGDRETWGRAIGMYLGA